MMRIATRRAAVSPVAHSSAARSSFFFSSFATARSFVRLTAWSSPWRALTARIFSSSSEARVASTSVLAVMVSSRSVVVIGMR